MQFKLSIIIPAYNEEENFRNGVLDQVVDFLSKKKFPWEVIFVDDGSRDSTHKLLQGFCRKNKGFRVISIPHGGKVKAVGSGIFEAKGDIVLFSDFDQSTPIKMVDNFLTEFKKDADVVIANRYGKGAQRTNDSLGSLLRSKLFNLAVQMFLMRGIRDTQCGFKAFRRDVAKDLFGKLQVCNVTEDQGAYMGAFDVEILFLAQKAGLKVVSVPVIWRREISNRLSLSEPFRMLFDVVKVRWFELLGNYGAGKGSLKSSILDILLPFIAILIFTYPAISNILVPGYFAMHDDLQAMRQLQMDKCFQDLQIPCRWVPDLGYGYGYPLFNYYPPMPYYLGQIFHWAGFSFLDVVKIVFALAFIVSAFAMYLLGREFWGKAGGVISATFYVWAPYHAVDVYVRGAMNEAWAIAWFPAILWALYKIVVKNRWRYVPLLAFFIGLLGLSHNPMLMIFAPAAVLWTLFWIWRLKSLTSLPKLIIGGVWATCLAAFFTLPVMFEGKYAHVETLVIGYFNYLAHFIDLRQLFIERSWDWGASYYEKPDEMSFQIGHIHWIFSVISLFIAWKLRKTKQNISFAIMFFFFWTYAYTFLAHSRATPIWLVVKPLEFLQFPWRFLTITILGVSFLSGSLILLFGKFKSQLPKLGFVLILFLLLLVLYKDYFSWREYYPTLTDEQKFSGKLWQLQITSGIFDYLPIWAPLPPIDPPKSDMEFIQGSGEYTTQVKRSNFQEYNVSVKTADSVLQVNTFYFPGWKVFIDGTAIDIDPKDDPELGRMRVNLQKGSYNVLVRLTDTPIRSLGNFLSLVSWGVLLFIFVRYIALRVRQILT